MTVQIAPNVEDLIEDLVESGKYTDASDVIEKAIGLLLQRDQNAHIVRTVREASLAAHRGEFTLLTDDLVETIRRNAEEADRLGLPISQDVRP